MVETKETGLLMLELSSNLTDKSFYIRLNTIPSSHGATTNDGGVLPSMSVCCDTRNSTFTFSTVYTRRTTSDIEIINMIQLELSVPSGKTLDMNSINITKFAL